MISKLCNSKAFLDMAEFLLALIGTLLVIVVIVWMAKKRGMS